MFCSKCGNSIFPGASFCSACGSPVAANPKQPAAPEIPDVSAYNQEPLNPIPAYNQEPLDPTPAYNQEPVNPAPVEEAPVQEPVPAEPVYQQTYEQPEDQIPAYEPLVPPVEEDRSKIRKGKFLKNHAKGGAKAMSIMVLVLSLGIIAALIASLVYSAITPLDEMPQTGLLLSVAGMDSSDLKEELGTTLETMKANHAYSYGQLTREQIKANEKTLKAVEDVVEKTTVLNLLGLVETAGKYQDDLVMQENSRDVLTQGLQWLKYGLIGIAAWYLVLALLILIAGLTKSTAVTAFFMLLSALPVLVISGWYWVAGILGGCVLIIILCECISRCYRKFLAGTYRK